MSGKDAASAAVFGDTLDKLRMSLTAVYNKIGAALAPMLNRITSIFVSVSAAVTKWLDKNRGIIALVAPIVAALGSAGASAIGLGLAFKIAAIAVGPALLAALIAVKTAIVTVAGVLAAVAIPALAVAAAIGGLTATIYALGITWTDVATTIANVWSSAMSFIGNSLSPVGTFIANWVSKIVNGFAWMYDGATQYFGAIGKALADGNLERWPSRHDRTHTCLPWRIQRTLRLLPRLHRGLEVLVGYVDNRSCGWFCGRLDKYRIDFHRHHFVPWSNVDSVYYRFNDRLEFFYRVHPKSLDPAQGDV
jgi:hypothetical protein